MELTFNQKMKFSLLTSTGSVEKAKEAFDFVMEYKESFCRAEEECRHKVFGRMVIDCYTTYGWIFVRGDGYRCAIDDELLEGEIIGNIHDNPELMKGGSNEA